MTEELKRKLERFGINLRGEIQTSFKIMDKEYDIPKELQDFFGAINTDDVKKETLIFFDRYGEGQVFDYNSIYLNSKEVDMDEYSCMDEAPFAVFARNGQYSTYSIRLDDESPSNPLVYYLGVDDYDEEPRTLKGKDGQQLRLVEFFQMSSISKLQ